jgi:hypothetical protein
MNMRSRVNTEAARRHDERRERENSATRLLEAVPDLVSLDLALAESRGEIAGGVTHIRHIVVASAPALFEIPCGDPRCKDGGHDLTYEIVRALRGRATDPSGRDTCNGSVGSATCGRDLHFRATAVYR